MLSLLAAAACVQHCIITSDAFSPSHVIQHNIITSPRTATTALNVKRRGRLANNVSLNKQGEISKVMTKKEKLNLGNAKMRKSSSSKKGKGDDGAATISPMLAEWASSSDTAVAPSPASSTVSSASSSSANVFVPFATEDDDDNATKKKKKSKSSDKEARRSARQELTAIQSAEIDANLEAIEEMIQTTNCDVNELLSYIQKLVDVGDSSTNNQMLMPALKSIVSARPVNSNTQPAYRLAWVGSDSAICHIGTSLHKVPLARLQEMYLLLGYNRWELLEVIRILGPFPNVRNTLKGDVKLEKMQSLGGKREGVRMSIAYNSMIDGTGKEILAGKEDNVKNVSVDVWFANEKAIVCTIPVDEEDSDGNEAMIDPLLIGNGSNVMFFVAEENLEEELEKLRAA